MRKSAGVLAVVVILGVAYVGASWYVGKKAQTTIEHAVAQANQRLVGVLGPDLDERSTKITITDYQRGIFSSDAMVTLQTQGPDGDMREFKLSNHLQHGPFPAQALRQGELAPMLALGHAELVPSAATQKWFDSVNGVTPVTVVTKVEFFGKGQSQWAFRPLNLSEGGNAVTFSGGTVDISFSNDYEDSTTVGHFESMGVVTAETGEDFQANGITLASKTTTSGPDATQTQSSAVIDMLSMTARDEPAVQIKKMEVALDSTQSGKLLDGSARYDLGEVTVGQANLGRVSAGIKASRWDVDALGALVAEYRAIKAQHGVTDDQELELTAAEELAMREKLIAVLESNPSISIDPFAWKTARGESSMTLKLDLMHPTDKSATEAAIDSLLSQTIKKAALDLSISRPMFVQAFSQAQGSTDNGGQGETMGGVLFDQYAGRLSQAGLIKIDGDNAVAAIRYEGGRVDANGSDMSVAEFFQRALIVMM